ncbi:MAG TPA: two-component regulator propeller domain-containing protein [Bacteroidia bacterium]|nr:two-component regulator propeller domain-containing protein [Bacteroidia bacterium]
MQLILTLFFGILTILSSCNVQSTSQVANSNLNGQDSTVVPGNVASELVDSILIIFQDKNNNYWFGSNGQGVYRYDGKTLTHFTTKDGLCHNQVREIKEDKSGNIYINTIGGISKFDGRVFVTLNPVESNSPDGGWKLEPDNLWFVGNQEENGPYRYDGKSLYDLEFPKHYLEDEYPKRPWSPYQVYTVYKDSRGNMWFGTSVFGICRYDGKSLDWMYEEHLSMVEGGGSFGIRSILEDKEGKFWFCNTRFRYDVYPESSADSNQVVKGNTLINYTKEKGIAISKKQNEDDLIYFMSITEDNKGNLWMVTYDDGVWRYDPSTELAAGSENMTHYPVKNGSGTVFLYSIYQDHRGDLWLGTHTDGAYKFNGKTFEKFKF